MLGPVDEVIREVERAFPDLTIIVRGNRVAIVSRSKQTEAQAAQAEDLGQYHHPSRLHRAYGRRHRASHARPERAQEHCASNIPVTARCVTNWRNRPQTNAPMHVLPAPTTRRTASPRFRCHHLAAGVPVRAKTAGQVAYVNAIESHTITFAIGPAGTGKTYLAVAKAVRAFQDRQVRRIILTRPAVEAGEPRLPAGHAQRKGRPVPATLYDALSDMLGADQLKRYMDDGTIEVAPLATCAAARSTTRS